LKKLLIIFLLFIVGCGSIVISDIDYTGKNCIISGKRLDKKKIEDYKVYLKTESGTLIKVYMLPEYQNYKYSKQDYNKILNKLYLSERNWKIKHGKDPSLVDYYLDFKIVGHVPKKYM